MLYNLQIINIILYNYNIQNNKKNQIKLLINNINKKKNHKNKKNQFN